MDSQTHDAASSRRARLFGWLKQHRRRLMLAIRLLTAFVLMAFVISLVADDWEQFGEVDWRLIPFAFVLTMVALVLKAARWSLLVRQSRLQMSFRYLLGTYLVGTFFSTVLPTSFGGDAVRVVDAAQKSGRAVDATSSVLVERGIGLLVVIGSGSIFGLLLEPDLIPISFQIAVHAMFFGGLFMLLMLRLGWFMEPFAAALHWLRMDKFERKTRQMQAAFSGHLGRPGVLLLMFFYSIISHAVTIWSVYIVLDAVAEPIPLGAFVPVIALTTTAELLPISIASLGVKESAYVFFLGMAGVGSVEATVVALIMRGLTLARALTGGIVYLARTVESKPSTPSPPPQTPGGRREVSQVESTAEDALAVRVTTP